MAISSILLMNNKMVFQFNPFHLFFLYLAQKYKVVYSCIHINEFEYHKEKVAIEVNFHDPNKQLIFDKNNFAFSFMEPFLSLYNFSNFL